VPDAVPAPFVWRDVALVYFLAALPLAATLATAVTAKLQWSAHSLVILLVESIVLLAVPQLYIRARCDHDANRAAELARQSRFGEASQLLHQILALRPRATWDGGPVAPASTAIDQVVRQIDNRVATPLSDEAADEDRIDRAQNLAMLGRTGAALAILASSPTLTDSPSACNLRGTIHETQDQWRAAREWYAKAQAAWQTLDDSVERTAGLVRAITGIAYCERKLGRLREAETAWLELLALSPSADSHFLVAQFYEDTQQATQARVHARQAMALAPDRYQVQGRRLLDKLVTSHFGCAGVFSAELSPSTPFGIHSQSNP
jgi:tetratricopeptide (TPR) repeat protein